MVWVMRARDTVVTLSTMSWDNERRPLPGDGSTVSRKSGASTSVLVTGTTVTLACVSLKQVCLHNQRGAGLAVVTRQGDYYKIAALQPVHPSVSRVWSSQVRTCSSARRRFVAARLCRRHSSANPRARVSGTQSCTSRNPARLMRAR